MVGGQKVVFSGEGDQAPGIIPGDIIIVIEEKEHDRFKRKGQDLYVNVNIELLTALAGGQIAIPHLDDRVLLVHILPGEVIKPGMIKAVNNEGMPAYKRPFDKGSLFIQFEINFPQNNWVDAKQLALLESILPPRSKVQIQEGYHVEEVVLSDFDQAKQRSNEYMDEDDEEHEQGGPQVQCAQQ